MPWNTIVHCLSQRSDFHCLQLPRAAPEPAKKVFPSETGSPPFAVGLDSPAAWFKNMWGGAQGTAASAPCCPAVTTGFVPGKENSKPKPNPLCPGSIFPEYPTKPCAGVMRLLCAAETSLRQWMWTDWTMEPKVCTGNCRYMRRKLIEFLADAFAWLTMHGEAVKREWLEMTPERQRDSGQTTAAKQSFSGNDKCIINMKGIWQVLWHTDSPLAGFFPGFLWSDNSNKTAGWPGITIKNNTKEILVGFKSKSPFFL